VGYAERLAGQRVHGRAIAAAVVCEHPYDPDAEAVVKGDGTTEEADRGRCLLVSEYFGVGESTVVVDRDVDVFPSLLALLAPVMAAAGHPVARTVDPTELLDVDVEELASA
jgi:hypothetical protein